MKEKFSIKALKKSLIFILMVTLLSANTSVISNTFNQNNSSNKLLSAELTWSGTQFDENFALNNGSIGNTITISLTGDNFVINSGTFTENVHYNVSNVPLGLNVVVTANSSNEAIISLTGNANSHYTTDDINNLTITFLDNAFEGGNASIILNSSRNDISINFYDPHDISCSNILSPEEYVCHYTNSELIKINIFNWSNDNFDCSKDNIIVKVTISGIINTILYDTIKTGVIPSYNSLEYTLPQTLDMSQQGEYEIEVLLSITNDSYVANNNYGLYIPYILPDAELGTNKYVCASKSIQLDSGVDGGLYSWSTGHNTKTITIDSTGVGIGYIDVSVTVTLNGCKDYDTVRVTFLPEPKPELGNPISLCKNTSYLLNPNVSNVSYYWSTNDTTSTLLLNYPSINLGTTTISLTVTDNNNCSGVDSVVVTMNDLPIANAGNDISIICGNSNVIGTSALPNHNYLWVPSTGLNNATIAQPTASPTITTIYTLEVTDNNTGCKNTDEIIVTVTDVPSPVFGGDSEICQGETAMIYISGGSSYNWSTGDTNDTIFVSPTTTTIYTVTVYSGNCNTEVTYALTVKPLPNVNLGANRNVCANTFTTLDAENPGASYLWSTGQTTQQITVDSTGIGLNTTNISVTVTKDGCSKSDSIQITFLPTPQFSLGPDISLCPSQTYVLYTTLNNVSYLWSTGATTMSITVDTSNFNIGPNTISLTVTDNNSCIGTDEITITYLPVPIANAGPDHNITCGNSVQLGTSQIPNHAYFWSPSQYLNDSTLAQPTATPLSNISYTLTVINTITNCTNYDVVNVNILNIPQASISGPDSICQGSSATLIASGGTNYTWSTLETTPEITVYPLTTTTYYVTVSDGTCFSVASHTINFFENPTVNLGPDISICSNGNAILNAGPHYDSYLWSTSETTSSIVVDTTGHGMIPFTVSVTVTKNGCIATDDIVISVKPLPVLTLGNDIERCITLPVTIIPDDFQSYQWSTGQTTQVITIDPNILGSTSGYVHLTVTDECGLTASDSIHITFTPVPTLDLGQDTIYTSKPDTISLSVSGFDSYLWSNGSTNNTFNVTNFGWVSLTVTHNGCSASDSILILRDYDLSIINIISPSSNCTLSSTENITVEIKNTGNLKIPASDTVHLYYKINASNVFSSTLVFTTDLPVNSTRTFTFPNTFNMSAIGQYNIKTYLSYNKDKLQTNDTLYKTVNNWGTPDAKILINNKLYSNNNINLCWENNDTLSVNQGVGYTYLWSNGATNYYIIIDTSGIGFNNPKTFSVTVTNAGGCTSTSNITITYEQCSGCVNCTGQTQIASNGIIRIGQYGSEFAHNLTYCPNSSCTWTITSTTGMRKIGITFDYFDIRYGDYLKIYKGHSTLPSNLIGSYNNLSMPPALLHVYSDSCTIVFTSDNSIEGYGSLIKWTGYGVGINETESYLSDIIIYPNPTKDIINIVTNNPQNSHLEITILNSLGQTLVTEFSEKEHVTLNVANLSSGIYVIKVKGKNGFFKTKIFSKQ